MGSVCVCVKEREGVREEDRERRDSGREEEKKRVGE
jgi:hypothetical protein